MWTMIEQLAITFMLELLQIVIKNPTTKAAMQTQLINICNDIAAVYGGTCTFSAPVTPPTSVTK